MTDHREENIKHVSETLANLARLSFKIKHWKDHAILSVEALQAIDNDGRENREIHRALGDLILAGMILSECEWIINGMVESGEKMTAKMETMNIEEEIQKFIEGSRGPE